MDNSSLTLNEVHRYFVQEYIPIICVFSLAGVIGTIGNVLTVIFYHNSRACSTNTLIVTLAWMDLFICVASFGLVVEVYLNVIISNQIFCSALHVLIYWATYSSIMTLWVISIDRYSKLCRPMKRQLSIKKAKIVAVIYISIAAVLSSRVGFTRKVVDISLKLPGQELSDTVQGRWCSDSPDQNLGTVVWAFHIIEGVCFIGVCLTLVITYSKIIRSLIGHHKELRYVSTKSSDYEQTREKKPKFKNKRKLSDNNDTYDCNSILEKVSEYPTTSLNVSDIEESKHTTASESFDNNRHTCTVLENDNGDHSKQRKDNENLSLPETNGFGSIKGFIEKVTNYVTFEKAVYNKPVQEPNAVTTPDTDESSSIGTSTDTLERETDGSNSTEDSTDTPNNALEKQNGVQKSQIHGHVPETVDGQISHARVSSTNTLQTSTSHKNTYEHKRWKTRENTIKRSERRVTFQTLAASIAFLCCFLPYMVMKFTQSKWQNFDENDFSVEMWIPFLLPILNSVINPFLYSVLNQSYRAFVKCCIRKILFCGIGKPRD